MVLRFSACSPVTSAVVHLARLPITAPGRLKVTVHITVGAAHARWGAFPVVVCALLLVGGQTPGVKGQRGSVCFKEISFLPLRFQKAQIIHLRGNWSEMSGTMKRWMSMNDTPTHRRRAGLPGWAVSCCIRLIRAGRWWSWIWCCDDS